MSHVVALHRRAVNARIRLLLASDLHVQTEGATPWPLAGKDGALLAWLAIEGPTPRERLARLLWPESDNAAARNALRQRIFKLKKTASEDVVVGRATLALAASVEHDLDGSAELLGDGDLRLSGELAGWLEQQRQQRRLSARQSLIDRILAAEARSDPAAALPLAHELLALDLLSEDAHRRLIRLHYAAGNRSQARQAFARCEAMLRSELGVSPSAETVALMKLVERSGNDASIDSTAAGVPASGLPASVLRPPQRIGREAVWAALAGAGSERRVVLLAGEAGLGKSRLLFDLAQGSAGTSPSTVVMTARSGDRAVPYATLTRGVRQLLTACALTPDAAAARELARLLPERGERAPIRRDDDAARLADALRAQLLAAAERGLGTLAVDDLHFADDASIAMLQMLIADRALAWLIAFRPAELSAAGLALLSALEAGADVETIRLEPFDRGQTRELLASLDVAGLDHFGDSGGGEDADSLHRRTGGNPMYVLETLKAALMPRRLDNAAAALSPTPGRRPWPTAANVSRLIEQRLSRLAPLALSVTRCAAVAGPDASLPLIAETLAVRPLDLVDAWSELERAQVFVGDRFAHDLIAEAALASVPESIGRALHGDVAAWLERHHGEPAHIADHWIAAQQPRRAAPHLKAAGAIARGVLQLAQATELYGSAARILREAGDRRGAFDALLSAAEAYSEISFDAGLRAYRDELRTLADEDAQRIWIDLLDIGLLIETKRLDEAERLTEAAMLRARAAGVTEVEAELFWGLAIVNWDRRQTAVAIANAQQALALLATLTPETLRFGAYVTQAKLTHALGLFFSTAGRYEDGERYLHEARDLAILRDDRQITAYVVGQLAENALCQGDPGRAATLLEASGAYTQARTPSNLSLLTIAPWARLAFANGQVATALALYEGVASFCESGSSRYAVFVLGHRARLHAFLGRRDLATASLRQLLKREGLLALERTFIDALTVYLGTAPCDAELVARCAGVDTFSTRIDMLSLTLPKAEPQEALALIGNDQALAVEFAAHGLWLKLQATRVIVLRGAGRDAEAAAAALAACLRIDEGVRGPDSLPQLAAILCPALAASESDRARRLALEARRWMQAAAAELPDLWRDNYLQRAPALEGFRSFA
ncbi:MAG: AAA family ATPase [Caldimonas sp.]